MMYLYIALGGAIGACLRFFVATKVELWVGKGLPFGTLAVNVVGSFLLGVFYAYMHDHSLAETSHKAFFAIGVLGAFTTFSTFSFDTLLLLQQGDWIKALVNIVLNVTLCIGAAALAVYFLKG